MGFSVQVQEAAPRPPRTLHVLSTPESVREGNEFKFSFSLGPSRSFP